MTAEVIALRPCAFRRGDAVITADGARMVFLGLVTPAEGEPLAKLWPADGGGCRFVRVGLIERDGRTG
jgi:hypothetical protein